MLGNNEKIQGVDLKAVFTKMLNEVPWDSLKNYIMANAPLHKLCTIGGFRLEPKHRARAEGFIVRDVEKGGYSEILCNGVFASWYPVHTELHETLEDYFHSEDYKAYREEKGLGEDEYVLNEEKFNEFYNVKDFEAWRILLCFSPLKFTAEQASKILEDKQGDMDMMARLTAAESARDELMHKVASLTAEVEKWRSRQQGDQNEMQEMRKQNRQFRLDNEALVKRAESAVAEMKRANQQVAQAEAAMSQKEATVRAEMQRVQDRLQGENTRLNKELATWQARHEEQCGLNRGLQERATEAEKRAAEAIAAKEQSDKKLVGSHKLVDTLLDRIDWPKVSAAMKPSPTVKRNVTSLMKRLDYDENRNLTIEGTLPEFWARLSKSEKDLVDAISKSTERELENGDIQEYWQGLAEEFAAVTTNLEARMAMLGILQQIFYQSYTDEDLETPALTPKPKAKAKAEEE